MKTAAWILSALLAVPMTNIGSLTLAHAAKKPTATAQKTAADQMPWGIAGKAGKNTRTIKVDMIDAMRFYPIALPSMKGKPFALS